MLIPPPKDVGIIPECYTVALFVERTVLSGDLRSFVIRFDFESNRTSDSSFESYVRFEIRFVVTVRFEIFESSALSIVIRKETIGGG